MSYYVSGQPWADFIGRVSGEILADGSVGA